MGRFEVQGIVAADGGLPYVQFRQYNDEGELEAAWQNTPDEAREVAKQIQEAATNAVYDAAIFLWAKESWPEDEEMGWRMLQVVRDHRADAWGIPDKPEDWSSE